MSAGPRRSRQRARRARRPDRDASALVEIVGPGGIGKTAVAIATGRALRPPGGVWLARLDMASTADDVVDTVIAALQVTGGEAALVDRLRRAEVVVILDNCEHVVDAAAELATRLLDACPALHVLCTSQVPLDVDGEHVVELAPLGLEDAVELFSRRATAQRARREHDTTAAVRDLCHSLDGLPLAIELAAARTRTLSVEEITRRLDDRFAVLSDPTSRKPERRRALGATIRWSYDLLFPDDQRGLWALATFAGGAPLAAVEYVLDALGRAGSLDGVDIISRLASRSLVIVDHDDSSGQRRYRLLDSIRAFALDAMGAAGHADTALAAHARWYADAARLSTAGRARQPSSGAPGVRPDGARQHRRRAGVVRNQRPDAWLGHRQRVRVGVGRARRQPWRPARADGARRRRRHRSAGRTRHGVAARLVDGGLHR